MRSQRSLYRMNTGALSVASTVKFQQVTTGGERPPLLRRTGDVDQEVQARERHHQPFGLRFLSMHPSC